MRAAAWLLAACLIPGDGAGDPPPPPESKSETLHGLRVEILEPAKKPEEGLSLLFFFHGYTGNGKLAATKLAPLLEHGFVIVAPWAKAGGWTPAELDTSADVAREMADRFLVARERRHVAGISGGGDGVARIAFDEALGFRTATWICDTWSGGSLPKEAKGRLAGLFLWGAREGPTRIDRYRNSASLLAPKVKECVARGEVPEPGLGRDRGEDAEIPAKLLPFWAYFLGTMEGKFAPDRDLAFAWEESLEGARAAMAERKAGGFAFVYSAKPAGTEAERARALQTGVFFDRTVRHFADQLVAVRVEKGAAKALLEEAKVDATPAIVVFKKGGREVLKSVSGEITAKALVPLLRAVAAEQDLPR
jgi:hypothetical protein